MTLQGACENLGTFYPQVDAPVFNGRNCGLGYTSKLCQLILAQLLKLANNTNRLTDRNLNAFFGRAKFFHVTASDNHAV